jgi:hypothetical protein
MVAFSQMTSTFWEDPGTPITVRFPEPKHW